MKNSSLIVLLLLFMSCTNSEKNLFFDQLPGRWERTNEEEGKATFEHWQKAADQEYTGMAFTLQQNDTVFKEDLRLYKKNDDWNLEVTAPDEQPVIFKVTEQNAEGFTAESPQNDYPKKVQYSLKNDLLRAKITGGGPEIIFDFEKMDK